MRRWSRLQSDGGRTALYGLAALLCVLTPLLLATGAPPVLRGPVTLLFFCLAPGCAVAAVVRLRSPAAEIALVVGASLASVTLLAQLMLTIHFRNLGIATVLLAELSFVALMRHFWISNGRSMPRRAAMRRARARANSLVVYTLLLTAAIAPWMGSVRPAWGTRPARRPAARPRVVPQASERRRVTRAQLVHPLALCAAFVVWLLALPQVTVGSFSGIGLVATLPVTYYVALGLLLAGFAVAVMKLQPRQWILAMYIALLVLVLHGTTAALYPEPRYTWLYKHLGVIDYIAVHGTNNVAVDIYQNWPGFFALNAWFSAVAGWKPINYAAWAPVFFELANVAALVFALRGLTQQMRHIWIACWIFVWANWVGQDYLSPQAFGFFEGLIVIGVVLRCSPRNGRTGSWIGARMARLVMRLKRRVIEGRCVTESRPAAPLVPLAALAVGGLCFLATVVSHQLTPFMLCALVAALTALRWSRSAWIPLQMTQAVVAWLLLAWPFVSAHFQLFSPDLATTAAPPGASYGEAPGAALVRLSESLVVALVVALAVVGAVMRLRARHWDIAVAALAVAPFLVGAAQSYGGEAMLRAYLFALPWLCFLAAAAVLAGAGALARLRLQARRRMVLAGVTLAVGIPFLFAYYGHESVNFVTPDDVAVNQWTGAHAPAGSIVGFVAANSPARLDARYADMSVGDPPTTLTLDRALLGHRFGPRDLSHVEQLLAAPHGSARYLVLSPSQANYLRYYGLVPPGWTGQLEAALAASPDFRPVFASGPAKVYQLVAEFPDG